MSYTTEKFLEAFKSKHISQFVNTLTGNDIKDFLIDVNRQVRELTPEEGGIYKGEAMMVGECISPKGKIQEKYFDKIVDFFKSVKSKNDMAIGMYYLINYLHLFQDGNGRTSRFIYEAMTNSNFKDYDGKFFRHKKGEITSGTNFCESKEIKEISEAKKYSGYATYQYLISMGLLPDNLKDKDLYCAKTFIPSENDDVFNGVFISEQAIDDGILTSEVRLVNRALKDNNESFSVGALTILMMLKLKEKEVGDYSTGCKLFRDFQDSTATRLSIRIFDEYNGAPYISEVLADWSREDYLRSIKIADKVKEMLLDMNMDIIQYPNDFVCGNGETFLNNFKTYTSNDKEDFNMIINSNIRINPETRTFKHMDALKKIIQEEQIKLTPENIGVIELGKQTFSEQKDIKAKQKELAHRNMIMQKKENTTDIIWN